jgi:O-antigen/teichoic acid export membrane protein
MLNKIVNFDFHEIKINKQIIIELFHFGKWMTLQNLSGTIFGSLDKIFLAALFGTTIVGEYNIIITVTQLSHYVLASASSFIAPKISAMSVTKKRLRDFYHKALTASALVTFAMLLILTILYPLVHEHFHLGSIKTEYFMLLISYGVLAMCVQPYYFALGFGKMKLLSSINTISALICIVAMMFFINLYGMLGAAIARLAYSMVVTITFLIPLIILRKY